MKRCSIHASGVSRARRSTSSAASIGRLAGGNSAAWSIRPLEQGAAGVGHAGGTALRLAGHSRRLPA